MSKKDEALKLAANINPFGSVENAKARDAAREALAEQPAQQQEPDLSHLRKETQEAIRGWIKDGTFFDRAIGTMHDQEKLLMAYEKAQQQEPVAWVCEASSSDEKHAIDYWPGDVDDLPIGTKLYTSPLAQQQEPYGWKVYGVNSLFMGEFAEADAKAEAKRIGGTCIAFPLYTSPQPAQQQEPVAWVQPNGELVVRADYGGRIYYSDQPIYRSSPASKPWVGLTDEQISDLWDGHTVPVFGKTGINPIVFARAIEAKLKEKNT